ncbi:unnamed protein product, partial [Pylaiella littoralis]
MTPIMCRTRCDVFFSKYRIHPIQGGLFKAGSYDGLYNRGSAVDQRKKYVIARGLCDCVSTSFPDLYVAVCLWEIRSTYHRKRVPASKYTAVFATVECSGICIFLYRTFKYFECDL